MQQKKTLVFGASENPARYSNMAINQLLAKNHPVVALGKKEGAVAGIPINALPPQLNDVDTVTLYINPQNQKQYYNYILGLHPKRIIFNPGAENEELQKLAIAQGIKTMEACTLVLLSTGQF